MTGAVYRSIAWTMVDNAKRATPKYISAKIREMAKNGEQYQQSPEDILTLNQLDSLVEGG